MDNILGTRLRELRLKNKKLQKNVAEFIGISDVAYGYYEKGERQPNPDILLKLADYFNVSVDYLLGRSENENPVKDIDKKLHDNNISMAASSKVDLGKLMKVDNKTAKLINTLIDDFLSDDE